jgi:hypothetical protein
MLGASSSSSPAENPDKAVEFETLLSRAYSDATFQKINAVLDDETLLANDICTAVMQGVVKRLCGVEYRTNTKYCSAINESSADGLYTVVLNFGQDINTDGPMQAWEHGLTFQKVGNEMILYQGWVSIFNLRQWLTGTSIGICSPMLGYSPARCVGNDINNFIKKIDDLKVNLSASTNAEEFAKILCAPFMTYDIRAKECSVARLLFHNRDQFKCHWKYFHFQGEKPVEKKSACVIM